MKDKNDTRKSYHLFPLWFLKSQPISDVRSSLFSFIVYLLNRIKVSVVFVPNICFVKIQCRRIILSKYTLTQYYHRTSCMRHISNVNLMYNPDPAHYMVNTSGQNYHTRKQSYGDIQIRNTRQLLGYQNIHQDIKYKRK